MLIDKFKNILKKKTLHHASFVYVGSLINGFSLLAVNSLLARLDGTLALYGIFTTAVLFLSTIAEMSDFGLNAGLLRFAPYYIATHQDDKLRQLIKIIWRWRVILTIGLSIGCVLFSYPLAHYIFEKDVLWPYLAFTSLGIGGVILLGLLGNVLQTQQRFTYYAVLQSLKGLTRLLLVALCFVLGVTNIFIYVAIYIVVPWVLFVANFHVFPKGFRHGIATVEVKEKVQSQLAHFSFWLTASSLVAIVASRVDQAVIIRFLGLEQQAIFSTAHQLLQFFPLLANTITTIVTPKIHSAKDNGELKILLKKTCKWIVCIAVPIALFISPSRYLVVLIFGDKYTSAMPLYVLFAYATLVNIITIPFSLLISVFKKVHLTAYSAVIQLFLSVLCNFIFIPKYGILGAGYSFVVVIGFQTVWYLGWAWCLVKKEQIQIH